MRRSQGSLALELCCCIFFLTIFSLLAAHLALAVYGVYFNDRACRDATRGAAQGRTATEALSLAQSILESHKTSPTSFVGSPTILGSIIYDDFGGTPPAQTSPFVQLTTETKVRMPFAALRFVDAVLQDGTIAFRQTYTFPIVRVK